MAKMSGLVLSVNMTYSPLYHFLIRSMSRRINR